MLDTMPYADLLAIYNAIAEKPVARFDTRANGARRTEAILAARGWTLAEAARLADVVLPDSNVPQETVAVDVETGAGADPDESPQDDNQPSDDDPNQLASIKAIAPFALLVDAFVRELTKPTRPAYIAAFLRRLDAAGPGAKPASKRGREMTLSQRKIVELCSRLEGATGKELAEGCGWPSIAARATCQKLADRYGYDLHESPKANGRGISFRMTAKSAAEEQAA
jgi:hypothetical protein